MNSFEWRNARNANHLIHMPLVSHGIAMCADWINGDVKSNQGNRRTILYVL